MLAKRDADLLAEAKAMKLEIDEPMNGEDIQAMIAKLMTPPPDTIAMAQQAAATRH